MWSHLYRAMALTGTNVLASHLYRVEPQTDTNVRHLYRVGGRWRWRGLMTGHLYRSVPPIGTNVVICTRAKNTQYKSKNRPEIYVRFSGSGHRGAHQILSSSRTIRSPKLRSDLGKKKGMVGTSCGGITWVLPCVCLLVGVGNDWKQ
jgi:hypothetical protein